QLFHGRKFRWAFFKPNGEVLETITHLVEEGAIKPVIEKTYSMANADIAFRYVGNGHRQGKTVILINN
ncbi:NAD(P)H oxidoreductase RTN4IP1, mitochondrial-like, partial [Saccoglossus kowalevskii]